MEIEYRILNIKDIDDYKSIRLELLKGNPANFGSSFEEESQFDNVMWERRLNNKNATSIAAYYEEEIVGICVVVKNPRLKMKHVAHLNSMYVKLNQRRLGISKGLLNCAFELLQGSEVELMNLSVVEQNANAIALYKSFGFIENGIDQKAIKHQGVYYNLILMSKQLIE